MPKSKSKKHNVRLSATLDEDEYAELTRLGAELDLSAAWMIRRAVSEFVARHNEGIAPDLPCADPNRNRLGTRRREERVIANTSAMRYKRSRMLRSLKGARFRYLVTNSLLPKNAFAHYRLATNRSSKGNS